MRDTDFKQRYHQRRKRAYQHNLWSNLLLLFLPVVATSVLFFVMYYSFFLSALLSIGVLPMFYTVDRRLRQSINGIGSPSFSYADGYKSFFLENKSGYFGVLFAFFASLGIALLLMLAITPVTPYIMNLYEGSREVYDEVMKLSRDSFDIAKLNEYLAQNGALLSKPMTIINGIIFFVPSFYFLFYAIGENLDNHYISSIVLPDLDKNVSSSQSRALARSSYGRGIYGYRQLNRWKYNWPYYVAYILVYAGLLYLNTLITIQNFYLLPLVIQLAPLSSMVIGFYLLYFVKINEYSLIEESQDILLASIPKRMQLSIRETFKSPNYIHGEESAIRGPFVPEPYYAPEEGEIKQDIYIYEPSSSEVKEEKKENNETKAKNAGGVFDFSQTQKGEDDK